MKKVLILAYDFPHYVSVGGWYNENGIAPFIFA
jgi:hypothetical protein